MLLVGIARSADSVFQMDTCALLNHVSRFVRRGVQIWRSLEGHVVAHGVGLRTHGFTGLPGRSSHMSHDRADVVVTERALDGLAVRQRPSAARDARAGSSLDMTGSFVLPIDLLTDARRRRG